MVRFLPLGNTRILVSFDRNYRIVDFYYSHDQAENHAMGHPFRHGISVDGKFAWVDKNIISEMDYLDDTLVGHVLYEYMGVKVDSRDFVDIYNDVYARLITISGDAPHDVRLFFHHDFYIYGNDIGDTAYYHPATRSVIHYKGRRYFMASTVDRSGGSIYQYAIGIKGFNGYEGTWKDAEDGELSMNPVAIGSVDSVISYRASVEPDRPASFYYYILAATSLDELMSLREAVSVDSLNEMFRRTSSYWRVWNEKKAIAHRQEDQVASIFRKSQFVIRLHLNEVGALMASSDSDILKNNKDSYYYVWPRDASIAAYALVRTLHFNAARRFFDFAMRTISRGGYFYHKYLPDGNVASSWMPWIIGGQEILPIQEDETALVLWLLWQYYQSSYDVEYFFPIYEKIVKRAADFLSSFTDKHGLPKSSYDLWEERYGVHTFTVATVYAALMAASNFARTYGDNDLAEKYSSTASTMARAFEERFYSEDKGYYARALINGKPDFTVDSQNLALFLFGMKGADDERLRSNVNVIMDRLWVKGIGGLARYENDQYQRVRQDEGIPGNPWIITTLWAARYFNRAGDGGRAEELLNWVVSHAQPSGILPEQVNPYDGTPLSVSPLVWSHAEFIITVLDLYGQP